MKASESMAWGIGKYEKNKKAVQRNRNFADFFGVLKDVEEFKGKTSVEVQRMIPDVWMEKYRKSRM